MKKYFWYCWVISFFLIATALTGCKTNDDPEINRNKETPKTSKLIFDLATYNNNLLSLQPATRGWRDWLIVCAVGTADIVGAWEGGKIGGAIGSIGGGR